MIGLLQRVREAAVDVDGVRLAAIGPGLLVLVGVERGDTAAEAGRLAERLLGYRVFPDDRGRMNRSVRDCAGGVLVVPQFTLAADTRKGTRAGFSTAADPVQGEQLFRQLLDRLRAGHSGDVASGRFGADMQVGLLNDGPVTFHLRVPPAA